VTCSSILKWILFADDTNLFHIDKDLVTLFKTVNVDLHKLSDWFKANLLSLNIKNTNMLFTNRKYNMLELNLELKIDGKILDCVIIHNFLE